jgi:general secretion pathway protein D
MRKSGVPILSDILGLGLLFGTTNNTPMRTELLVLITPRIVRGGAMRRPMTNELRERMQDVSPLVRTR